MAATSSMTPLGSPAPDFELTNTVDGRPVSLGSVRSRTATVVMFICNHCPYVVHVNPQIVAVANDYQSRGISFVAISANDAATHPADGPANMARRAEELDYPFPYLYDETQATAAAYGAVCTPDFFVYDGAGLLAYRGRMDASTPGNDESLDGSDLRAALDDLLAGRPVSGTQLPSMGCSIKWR